MEFDVSKKTENTKEKIEKKISIALMAPFVILTIQYFILIYFNLLRTSLASTVQLLSKLLVGIVFIYALPAVLKRSKTKFILFYFTAVFIFILHYALFPENRLYFKELIFPVFFMSLPAFVYSLSIRDFSVLKIIMKKSSNIVFVFGVLLGTLIFLGRASAGTYSMSLSYYMLLPTIIFLDELLEKFSTKNLTFVIISLLVILALGSRGPILCIIVFVVLKLLRPGVRISYKKAIVDVGILCVGLTGYIFLNEILEFVYNFLLELGIRSRTIQLFLREEIYLSGRDKIYLSVYEELLSSPILGLGIAGDRRVLGGSYAHNIFLEILSNFGLVFGFIIVFLLVVIIIKVLFLKELNNINIIWISLGFIHLIVSSSYITDIKFWIFLGIIVNSSYNKGKIRIIKV